MQLPERFERKRHQTPRPERIVHVCRVVDVQLQPRAQRSCVLVKGRLEPAGPQPTTLEPGWRDCRHCGQPLACIETWRTEQLEWPGRPAAFRQRRAFK